MSEPPINFKEEIAKIIHRLDKVITQSNEGEFLEEDVKIKFVDDLLEALGWDVRGHDDTDEVRPEQTTLGGRVDFSLRLNNVDHTIADVSKAQEVLNYKTSIDLTDGLGREYEWTLPSCNL